MYSITFRVLVMLP